MHLDMIQVILASICKAQWTCIIMQLSALQRSSFDCGNAVGDVVISMNIDVGSILFADECFTCFTVTLALIWTSVSLCCKDVLLHCAWQQCTHGRKQVW